ncbi:flagellar protein FlgN [Pandoraea pulmonicola]|uniref:FlgN protein n=1 Tax=Pandoraea pulmonicola TaxID=93221 RepID=A0AAJ4ZB11_PANPU|nr:flagellar protein FlgN [Pandoraea pulmonicola]AJC21223.1 hypothetical protein RO07_13365 [Pandoraea pulmonicola]SUA90093.1 FlgN protein [Pandoraea pulmonicola]
MTRKEAFKALVLGIEIELTRYHELKALLERQYVAAMRRDATGIERIAQSILTLVDTLAEHHELRRIHACILAAPSAPASMMDVLDCIAGAPRERLMTIWSQLETLVRECKTLNARNGQLLVAQFEVVQRALYGETHIYAET